MYDAENFTAVFQQYKNLVFSVAYNYCRNVADANDITQETFLSYLKSGDSFETEEHLKAWLIRVTINKCKTLLVSPWFQRTIPLDETYPFEEREDYELFHAVMTLPKKYRVVIHLYYYVGYSTKEIAHILSLGESTVRVRLLRARDKLKEILEKEGLSYEYGEI